jgi:hypothetical protein
MTPSGVDETVGYGGVQPRTWPRSRRLEDRQPDHRRAFSDYDPYARYYWVNGNKVKNVKIRQAMAVALIATQSA